MNMKACVLLCALVTVWWSVSVLHAERCTSRSKDRALNLQCQKLCLENSCPSYCICPNYKAVDTCAPLDVPENSTLKVLETASPGTVLLSVNVTGQEEWDLTLGRDQTVDGLVWSHLSSYLKLSQLGGTYEMSLERTLDLEWIFRRYGVKLRSLNLNLICRTSSAQDLDTRDR
ncbi:uncharacterized protein LOC131938077 [Physella acuta]|uniref:uncharacterized protein LOC131938077 n=1 Tax=Physella acuta TaxID=109671 RepID=UPI0027DC6B52|nr:uncharacterized protein LOC131938077 [Physella acuta]